MESIPLAPLTDLIPEEARLARSTEAQTSAHTWEALQVNPEAPLTEDDYLLASPEEDLLSGDGDGIPARTRAKSSIFDSIAMEQLESDLDRLEDSQETIAAQDERPKNERELEETETLQTAPELSDADLDAIFPAFLLTQESEEADDDTPTGAENAEVPPSAAQPPESSSGESPKTWVSGAGLRDNGSFVRYSSIGSRALSIQSIGCPKSDRDRNRECFACRRPSMFLTRKTPMAKGRSS